MSVAELFQTVESSTERSWIERICESARWQKRKLQTQHINSYICINSLREIQKLVERLLYEKELSKYHIKSSRKSWYTLKPYPHPLAHSTVPDNRKGTFNAYLLSCFEEQQIEEGTLLSSVHEVSNTLTPKPDKAITRKLETTKSNIDTNVSHKTLANTTVH